MHRFVFIGLLGALMVVPLLALGGCSDDGGSPDFDGDAGDSPCDAEEPPSACDTDCSGEGDCPSGFYCRTETGKCYAQCSSETGGCPVTHECDTSTGTCNPVSGPCAGDDPFESCGIVCNHDGDCPFDFDEPTWCRGSICTAQCDPNTHEGCASDEHCDLGICKDGAPIDAGPDDSCQPTVVTPQIVNPTVVLIVDQSGSMTSNFGGVERWDAAIDALVGDEGVVTQLDDAVRFGLVLYSSSNCHICGGNCICDAPATDSCPDTTTTDPGFGSFGAIDSVFDDADPEEDTPTGDTIDYINNDWLPSLPSVDDSNPNDWTWDGDPIVYVLVTDGEPDMCANADPSDDNDINDNGIPDVQEAQDLVVSATEQAHDRGIPTYVIRVAADSSHFDDVADAGGTGEAVAANNPDELSSALQTIVAGEVSCDVELEGRITDIATVCDDDNSSVTLNGNPLTCGAGCDDGDTEGWCAIDDSHIRILGDDCEALQRGGTLEATFDCEAFVGL
ncbi:MAG: vWA domain-containing protein [Myxococcota bacterium]